MERAVVAGLVVLVGLSGCSAGSTSVDRTKSGPTRAASSATECTAATARATDRAQIRQSAIEPACVRVRKGRSFTLLNSDTRSHALTTTGSSPVHLQVDLRKAAAFPYRFGKVGTYTFQDAGSHLTLTVIVS